MKLWTKFWVVILGIVSVTVVAATIKKVSHSTSENANQPATAAAAQPGLEIDARTAKPAADPVAVGKVLRLLTSRDSDFSAVLEAEYPGFSASPGLEDLQSRIVLVQNETDESIRAFVVKWQLQAEGRSAVKYSTFMNSPAVGDALTGAVVLSPHEKRILSPWFTLSSKQYNNIKYSDSPAETLSSFLHASVPDAARDVKLLNASVDSVIAGDPPNSRLVGADEAKVKDRYECERNAQHDEGLSISRALGDKSSDQQIIEKLNQHISRGNQMNGRTDREGIYYAARGKEAEEFLQALKQGGRSRLEEKVNRANAISITILE
jgi:hypothetical protein